MIITWVFSAVFLYCQLCTKHSEQQRYESNEFDIFVSGFQKWYTFIFYKIGNGK